MRVKQSLSLQPVSFPEACEFIARYHRHLIPPVGWKFGIGVNDGAQLVGVITIGRPVSRMLDNGLTLEINRCCTDGTRNAASLLYGAAWRATKALGYQRLITYTLQSEGGASLRGAGFIEKGPAGGLSWTRPSRPRFTILPEELKTLWEAA